MANYTVGSVYVVTSSAAQAPVGLPHVKSIMAIKYVTNLSSTAAGPSSAALLSNGNSSTGGQLWFDNRIGGPFLDLLSIYDPQGVSVSLTGGGSIWIYSKVDR